MRYVVSEHGNESKADGATAVGKVILIMDLLAGV